MKCPKCGADNEKDAKFCAVCGTSLETVEEEKETSNSEKPKKKEKKFIFVALAGVLVIIAVIVAGIWVTKENQVKKQYQDHLASGQKYLEELNYESAEDSYLKAIAIDPKKPEPYLKLIDTYIAQEKYDDAAKIAKQAQKKVPEKDVEEFQKLEKEYDSVLDYEWVVEPTIEADDIYYLCRADEYEYLTNEIKCQDDRYAIIQKNGKYGLINIDGQMYSELIYKKIYNTPYGLLLQREEKRYIPEIDRDSEFDILYQDGTLGAWDGLMGSGGTYRMVYWYDNQLHNLNECLDDPGMAPLRFPEEAIPVRRAKELYEGWDAQTYSEWTDNIEGKYAVCKEGNLVTDFIYDALGSCRNGVIAAEKDGKWGYINEMGETIIPFEYDASWGKGFVYNEFGYFNGENEEIPFCYAASGNTIVLVKNEKWKIVDIQGNTVIPTGVFETIRPVYDGKCWVKKDGRWGVIQISDKKEETEKTEEKKSAQMSIATGEYKFASGELLSEFHIAEENGKKNCDLMFWHNSGAAMADEDFYFEWNDQQSTYEVQGKSSRNMFHITFTPIDDKSIKIEVVCNEEFFDWKTGEKSKSWSSEVYTKVEETTGIQDWSVTEIGNAVAKHYNTINHSEDYVVFDEESTQTESGYEVIVRYQGGTTANVLVTTVTVDTKTGKATTTDTFGESWYLQEEA